MGQKMASGRRLEPTPIAGKAPFIKTKVQAAHDGQNLYLRFTWTQPKASGAAKMDDKNPVKIAYMLEAGSKVEMADRGGCWSSCHGDARTMPDADDAKTKYVKDGSLAGGVYYDLEPVAQRQEQGVRRIRRRNARDGRRPGAGRRGRQDAAATPGRWIFTRKLAGGAGDVALVSGQTYNFGFAIHDDNAAGRYHHVSLGYQLGIDAAADITAAKQ